VFARRGFVFSLLPLQHFVKSPKPSFFSSLRINKPGGCAKITKVHYATDGLHVESVDVKYVLGGGFEKEIDPAIVSPFETLKREGRKRRGRDFLMGRAEDVVKKVKQAMSNKKTTTAAQKDSQPPVPNTRTTAEQRDHSTSPSTPVTPEHPSVIKASKPSKTVSSMTVPSYVIADTSSVEVSPLQDPLNRMTDESKKTTIARRGLFGVSKTKTEKSILPAKENRKDPNVGHAEDDGLSCSTSSPLAPQTSQEVRRAHSAAVKLSLSKKQNKSVAQTASWTDRKQATVAVSKKTSSLKNVFDQELRKAREFLDDVCRAPHKDIEEEHVDPTSKETRLDTSGSEPDDEDDKKPAA
jgi:hypothetical protein